MSPTYEYECLDCGHVFEIMCLIAERKDEKTCPKCARRNVKLLIPSRVTLNRSQDYIKPRS